jgi:hypothetical protein
VEDLNTTDAPTAMEKEVVESEGLDDRGNDSLLSESHEVFHAGASTEYNEKAQESPGKPSLLDMYSKEESVQVEEGDILEDRERPTRVTVDGAHEQLRDMAFREAGPVPLPSQISAIAKGRKNKNKTYDGGVEPAAVRSSSPQIPDLMTPGAMPEGESSYNVNSAHLDPGLAAQVSTMQDALNQVQRSYFLLFLLELAEIVSFWVDISRQIGQVLVA